MAENLTPPQGGTKRKRRPPKPMNAARLERIALHHLDRYPSSVENLRRVLERRAEKSRQIHEGDPSEHSEWIQNILKRFVEIGHLNDGAYGTAVARRLRNRGSSQRLIAARLAAKGLSSDIIRTITDEESEPNADQKAARIFVRRRGLGHHRQDPLVRTQKRERDLAALARAGFTYSVAQAALEDPIEEEN